MTPEQRKAADGARYRRTPLLCVTPDGLVIDHYRVDSICPLTTAHSLITDLRGVNRPEDGVIGVRNTGGN